MQVCTAGRQHEAIVGGRSGATARRLCGRAVRLACAAGPIAALALVVAATLPAPDGGGQLMASALADERPSDGAAGGRSRDTDDADYDADAQGETGDDGDDGYDGDDGRSTGDKGGKNGGRGIGKTGGRGGANADSSTGHGDPGDDDDRDDAAEAHGDGHDPSAGATPGDLSDGELEDRVVAAGIAPGLASFRATVLSDDEEAAAIAAGWTTAD